MKNDGLSDSDLIFMINTAQHVKRPVDMLMFLGEYFKNMIKTTGQIEAELEAGTTSVQDDYFLTNEILNSLAVAIKMYIDDPRQELRISIALARNPLFEGEQLEAIKA